MAINIQKALGVAGKFLGNDKIQKAVELSKSVNSPQDAINALKQMGDPNQIIDGGLEKLNSPMASRMAGMFGASEQQLEAIKSEIMGLKGQSPTTQSTSPNMKTTGNNTSTASRFQKLLNGLK